MKYSWQIQPSEWAKTSNVWFSLFLSIFSIWSNWLCSHFCGVQESSKSHHDDDYFAGICLSNTRATERRLWLGRNLFKAAFFSLGKRSARFEKKFWNCWALEHKIFSIISFQSYQEIGQVWTRVLELLNAWAQNIFLLHLSNQNMIYQDINLVWSRDEIILKRQLLLFSGWLGWTWTWGGWGNNVDSKGEKFKKILLYLYSFTLYYF